MGLGSPSPSSSAACKRANVTDQRNEKAKVAFEHMQEAALQMIAAARAMLDIAEEMVKDPAPIIEAVTATAEAAAAAGARLVDPTRTGTEDMPTPPPRGQHNRVS